MPRFLLNSERVSIPKYGQIRDIPDWPQDERLPASPAKNALGLRENFFGGNSAHLSGLDFVKTPIDLRLPGSFGFWIAGVQILGQVANKFTNLFGRASGVSPRDWHGV
jgi:hypothetical protein